MSRNSCLKSALRIVVTFTNNLLERTNDQHLHKYHFPRRLVYIVSLVANLAKYTNRVRLCFQDFKKKKKLIFTNCLISKKKKITFYSAISLQFDFSFFNTIVSLRSVPINHEILISSLNVV